MRRLLAALVLLPALAQAQPLRISGADSLLFWWTPAAGAVAYEVKLVYFINQSIDAC